MTRRTDGRRRGGRAGPLPPGSGPADRLGRADAPLAPPRAARPLLVTADEALLDDVLRLAAAAATEVDVVADPALVRSRWTTAAMVVVGRDLAAALEPQQLPRRGDVVLLGDDLDDPAVWALGVALGAGDVRFLPADERWLVGRFADCAERRGSDGVVVAVVAGRGGAGASTLSAALASSAASRGHRTMLLDADPLGGGIDLLLGGEDVPGLRWPQLAATRGRVSASALADGLPAVGEVAVLSFDRGDVLALAPESMGAVLASARRLCELVVVDLPRAIDPAAREVLAVTAVTYVLVPAEVRATAAAARVCATVCASTGDVRLVVRGPAPSGLTGEAVAETLGLPLAGFLRPEPRLASATERGEPPGQRSRSPLGRLCGSLLDDLERSRLQAA